MENEIDYKKLESCMIELFGDPSWDMYDKVCLNQSRFLTTNALVIASPNERKASILPDTSTAKQFQKYGRNVVDKEVCLALELGTVANDPAGGNHMAVIKWVIGLYITKYVIKQSDSSEFKSLESCRIKDMILDPLWRELDKTGIPVLDNEPFFSQYFTHKLKLVRVVFPQYGTWSSGYPPGTTLNIESHWPLTSSQRRFLLDVIEGLNLGPDEIYIDDYSESAQRKKMDPKLPWVHGNPGGQCVKRQLGLHFF
jgi:hypothetical protein